jgi:hypothetical protein
MSNTGPFGIPPGGPFFVFLPTGTIQRQSNPAAAFALATGGWQGYPSMAAARAAIADNPVADPGGRFDQGAAKAGKAVTGGLNAIGDLAHRLTEVQTWIRVGEVIAGALLLYLGLRSLLEGTPAARTLESARNTAGRVITFGMAA